MRNEGRMVKENWMKKERRSGDILCSRLRKLRLERELSQEDLAFEIIGTDDASQISRYENGKVVPSSGTILRFSLFFKVSSDYLLGLSKSRERR